MKRVLLTCLALLALAVPAFAQSAGTVNLVGPSTSPGAPQITPFSINFAVNAALAAKANYPVAPTAIAQGGATTGQAIVWSGSAWAPATVPFAAAVATETSRATAAEALLAPRLDPTFTGSVGMFTGPVASGTTLPMGLNLGQNYSGSYSGTSALNLINVNSDTIANAGPGGLSAFHVLHQFGGTGNSGDRRGASVSLIQNQPVDFQATDPQYVSLIAFYDALASAGGTGLTPGLTRGNAYAFYPQVWLHPGAINYNIASLFEGDVIVNATQQDLAISGSVTAGDVTTVTFTSGTITGSPVSVTYTAAAGNVPTHITNGLIAAINTNANLQAAGVAASQDVTNLSTANIVWQTQTTVVVAVGTTGATVLTLGSVVPGASTKLRIGASIARGNHDGQKGTASDIAFALSDSGHSAPSGQWEMGFAFGAGQVFPVAYDGTMIGTNEQRELNPGLVQGSFSPLKAKYGIDFRAVNFSLASGASLRVPGFSVDGTGVVSLKNARLTTDTNGLAIDVTGVVGSGNPAVVSGGGGGIGVLQFNYFVGDIVKDANGGQYLVAAVNNSTGAVTSLTTLVQPSAASAWGTGLATTGGSGSGLTITPTAVASTTLSLNASGGPIKASLLTNAANDAAAATAGVGVGQLYRNGSIIMQRVSWRAISSTLIMAS